MKKLLILSGKGGTGKTTVATAFITFSKAGAVADCDVDAPNLHLALRQTAQARCKDFYGGNKARVNSLTCVACGKCEKSCRFDAIKINHATAHIDEIACEGCGVCQLVCPTHSIKLCEDIAGKQMLFCDERVFSTAELKMGRGNSGKLVSEVKFSLFDAAKNEELAIIDGSPGIGCPVIASISGVDLVLVVAEPSVSGLSDLSRLFKTARTLGTRLAVCINKYDINEQKACEIEDFCKENGICFVGKIPFDEHLAKSVSEGTLIDGLEGRAKESLMKIYKETVIYLNQVK